jgi:hypothetical protein
MDAEKPLPACPGILAPHFPHDETDPIAAGPTGQASQEDRGGRSVHTPREPWPAQRCRVAREDVINGVSQVVGAGLGDAIDTVVANHGHLNGERTTARPPARGPTTRAWLFVHDGDISAHSQTRSVKPQAIAG